MTLHWAEKLQRVFEAIEDEENPEFDPRAESEPSAGIATDMPEEEYDSSSGMSILSIPDPKPGKTLDDLKKVYGPPWMMVDGERVLADPTIEYDEEEGTYKRKYKRPMGKVTQKLYDRMPEELQSQYKAVMVDDPETGDRVVDYYEPARATIDQEFIGTPEDPWTFDEVVSALKPSLLSRAFRTATSTMSADEAAVTGINAIRKSWLTDLGIAPFPSHVFKMIRTEIERAAAGAAPVSGMTTSKGGTVDPFKASKAAVSADVPMGGEEQEAPFSSIIPGEAGSGAELAQRQEKQKRLIVDLAYDSGLTDKELLALMYSLGYSASGDYLKDAEGRVSGPLTIKAIADKLGVSSVMASKYRKRAIEKIQNYLAEKGYGTEESAMAARGVEEAVLLMGKAVIEAIQEIARLEYEMLQEFQTIKIDAIIDGINRSTKAKVRTENLELVAVLAEGDENILSQVDSAYIAEAKQAAATKISNQYFCEMVTAIVNMKTMPVLAVIGAKEDNEEDTEEEVE